MARTLPMLLLLAAAVAAPAQTAGRLAAQYGEPDAERFLARPGITLMARYGEDRTACEIVIEPIHSIIPQTEPDKYMEPEVVEQIVNEILPEADRGKLQSSSMTKTGCNDIETKDYENLTIVRVRHCGLPTAQIERTAKISYKRPSCKLISNPPEIQRP